MFYDEVETILPLLNKTNGADRVLHHYIRNLPSHMKKYEKPYNIVLMGIAYGGDVEAAAKGIGKNGVVWGYDTFEEQHPRHLAISDHDREATCMEHWYKPEINGLNGLDYKYQIEKIEEMKLHNTFLIKGEVNRFSCSEIDEIHLAFLDMDILTSMQNGYEAIKDKMVPGSFLFMHDVVSKTNLPRLREWFYNDFVYGGKNTWEIEGIWPESHLAGLRKIR